MSSTSGTASTGCDSTAECEFAGRAGEAALAPLLCSTALSKPRSRIPMGSCLSRSANQSVAGREAPPVPGYAQAVGAAAGASTVRADGTSVLGRH